ncbi:hypothetical protein M9979_01470 [Sphingomonas sp. RP10(2022)]|uniref:Uncharacterized protein n=1 Tax=Sphingomonas liriopis TaxID=2949094 RepID=A0A9X2HM75_9SPHN|nr:hypothetical protein [Sphingomonas liriopis]MCP3733553.1 hypothetical protein [Sphingomonas liriopis]
MDLDDQMRRYFGTADLSAVPAGALAGGIEHMRVDLGLERDSARRFALWTLLYMLDAAPALDAVFDSPADRDAARDLMEWSERLGTDDAPPEPDQPR